MELKLAEFRVLYQTWKRGIPWLDHLILGLLVWLEEKLIDARVKAELDQAIEDYKMIEPSLPDMVTPIYTETQSPTSQFLPEMRLQAPWRR